MALPDSTKSDFISNYRKAITKLLNTLVEDLAYLRTEYTTGGLGAQLLPTDFQGTNAGLVVQDLIDADGVVTELQAVVNTPAKAVKLYKLKYGRNDL
jgi:hypothetical protein